MYGNPGFRLFLANKPSKFCGILAAPDHLGRTTFFFAKLRAARAFFLKRSSGNEHLLFQEYAFSNEPCHSQFRSVHA